MGKKREIKEPVIPPQDKRICGGICLCQFTVVISCVALVYLAVAVYMPSYRAFTYGMEPEPVMCQAINTTMANNYCDWASCGEWCLTKTSGFCPQIHVTTRRNGTTIDLKDCKQITKTSCPKKKPELLPRFNCNLDNECATLSGVFNCSLGHCTNMSELFINCGEETADGITVDSDKDNLKLNGFFWCKRSRCVKFRRNLRCDRICSKITTAGANFFLQQDDNIWTGNCQRVIAYDQANGNERGEKIEAEDIWNATKGVLLVSCHTVRNNSDFLHATDCLNGTLINSTQLPQNGSLQHHQIWGIMEKSDRVLDPTHRFLPPQRVLTIFNYSRLYINLEGCVNTLKGECFEFLNTHGNDGDNQTAQSRFHCFYKKNESSMVVARFDLKKTWLELMIAIFVPSTLFVISFITLVIIAHSVHVGDDTRMRCRSCLKKRKKKKTAEEINAEMDLVMDGIIERTNAMADSPIANTAT